MHTSSVVLIAMLTSVLTAAGTSYLIDRFKILPGDSDAGTVVVPELKGLLESDARTNAEAVRVALLVAGREPTEEQKDGTVLRQSIPAGQRVPPNHPVSVVLAQEVLKVPAVTGLPIGEATLKLKDKGFEIKAGESIPSAEIESGLIAEQSPPAGGELKRGETVTVKTSSGPDQVEVPKLLGFSHNQAKEALEKLGLKAKVSWVSLAETASYVVIQQKPPGGDKLKPGEEVALVINR
jgi:eukaryotic-like serine/threonine-protein kinase